MRIRRARPSDAAALCAAERAIAREPGFLVSRPRELEPRAFEARIRAAGRSGIYVVAEEGGRPIGHAVLEPMGLEAIRHVVRLTIAVHRGFQGRGVGRALMDHVLGWARRAPGVEKVELNVRATNRRAIRPYERCGFRVEGRLRRRVRVAEGRYVDDVMMGRFVN